jgi:alkylation response protein AidB-like acyl-CoA dehydrogenase
MTLVLTEDARIVRESALAFFQEQSPVSALRRLRDANDPDGFSRGLWRQMAELGWTGFLVPEDDGGSGFGMVGLAQVMEAAGRTLAATPLLSTALIGASLLALAGSDSQKADILAPLLAGEHITALALEEGSRHAPDRIELRATRDGSGWRLDGQKTFVLDGHIADTLIVAGRTESGVTLFLVSGDAAQRTRLSIVDSRNAASIRFDGVCLAPDAVLGPIGGGGVLLEVVLDRARAGLAAEMLGSAQEAFDRTLQYLKDRKQFGVTIGSFQALKHRAATMFCEVEMTRSAVLAAASALDTKANDAAALVCVAKAKANDTLFLCGNEGVQMHGGIGMTDEHEIGFFLKRARVAQITFGDSRFTRDRYASLMGY